MIIQCRECRQQMEVDQPLKNGDKVRCPHCGTAIIYSSPSRIELPGEKAKTQKPELRLRRPNPVQKTIDSSTVTPLRNWIWGLVALVVGGLVFYAWKVPMGKEDCTEQNVYRQRELSAMTDNQQEEIRRLQREREEAEAKKRKAEMEEKERERERQRKEMREKAEEEQKIREIS